jgi:hypothetical protein
MNSRKQKAVEPSVRPGNSRAGAGRRATEAPMGSDGSPIGHLPPQLTPMGGFHLLSGRLARGIGVHRN